MQRIPWTQRENDISSQTSGRKRRANPNSPRSNNKPTKNKRFQLLVNGRVQPGDMFYRDRKGAPAVQYTTSDGTEFEDVPNMAKIEMLWDHNSQKILLVHGMQPVSDENIPLHPQLSKQDVLVELQNSEETSKMWQIFTQKTKNPPRIFLLQAIKYDGTSQGLPVSHIYSTVTYQDHLSNQKKKVEIVVYYLFQY